jgi:malate dehydrogenase (oxaloacetate-decarboxylating)
MNFPKMSYTEPMDKVYEDSLKLHREHHGKLGVMSKVSLEDKNDLSLAYTPGVAEVCREIGKDPALAREYTLKRNTVAIVSDGSAILGLGNLGPEAAIPVMEGKAVLFKKFADVDAFPICLATQDVEEIIETVKRIAPVFGGINLEDISAPRCFEIEERLQKELFIPVMHDDQHGTAVVVLAGLVNALAVRRVKREATSVLLNGAGAAGIAIAKLLLAYGFRDITLCDTKGAIYKGRPDLNSEKQKMAEVTNPSGRKGDLAQAIAGVDVFIGVSKAGLLTEAMVRSMAAKPIIFGLANPVPEIMPDVAKSAGAFIVATGRSDFPNQVNNVLAFPGIFRGALDHGVRQFTDKMFIAAAVALAACVASPSPEKILPGPFEPGISAAVAEVIRN